MKCKMCDWTEFYLVRYQPPLYKNKSCAEIACKLCNWPAYMYGDKADKLKVLLAFAPSSEPTDVHDVLLKIKMDFTKKLLEKDPTASVAIAEVETLMMYESSMTIDWLRKRYSERMRCPVPAMIIKPKDREYMKARNDIRLEVMKRVAKHLK